LDLVVATRNRGKLAEIRRLLEGSRIRIRGMEEFPDLPEVEEDGLTFAENARKKAEIVSLQTGLPALADDSGLTVEALGGQPGVRSARYAGDSAGDGENNRKLLEEMKNVQGPGRRGAFVCAMALCLPGEECRIFTGRLNGFLLEAPRGEGGFGYDPLFLVPEYGKTLAELSLDIKNRISHRGEALRGVMEFLDTMR